MAMHWETLSGKFSLAASMLAMLYAQTNDRIVVVSNYTQVPYEPYALNSSPLTAGRAHRVYGSRELLPNPCMHVCVCVHPLLRSVSTLYAYNEC